MTTQIPTQAEYHNAELTRLFRQLQEVNVSPIADRREAAKAFYEDCHDDPTLVAERISWLLNGSYGYGAWVKAKDATTLRNPNAALFYLIASLEWLTGDYYAAKVWRSLNKSEQAKLNEAISAEVAHWQKQQADIEK